MLKLRLSYRLNDWKSSKFDQVVWEICGVIHGWWPVLLPLLCFAVISK
jgi:hypothetical protein